MQHLLEAIRYSLSEDPQVYAYKWIPIFMQWFQETVELLFSLPDTWQGPNKWMPVFMQYM